ncbi:hypothetical protein [Faecalibaculum rodentium]|uniref:hypothetical protein n=1 Tax=Faecalibaculum rodentium TaxID=1702221 RepID=UPI0023F0243B|nr:hypothetical protein [Faecalibaculum rodentium]
MNLDSTITYAIILSFCAIIVPTIGTVITARSDRKLKRLELQYDYYKQSNQRIIKYLEDYGAAFLQLRSSGGFPTREGAEEHDQAKGRALPYLSEELFEFAANLDCGDSTDEEAFKLLFGLREQIETLKEPPKL